MPTSNYCTDGVSLFCLSGTEVFKFEDGYWRVQQANVAAFTKFHTDLTETPAPSSSFVRENALKGMASVLVEKANPYHDAKGRFSSRASAGFISLWGKKNADLDSASNSGANAKAAQHHKQKVKEFSKILGTHVRGGGELGDAFGKAVTSQAQLHASGAKAYGTHSVPNIGPASRQSLDSSIADAYASSKLSSAQKVKAGIPLTDDEKAAVSKANEYAKQYHSKKQAAKSLSDLEGMAVAMAEIHQKPGYEKTAEFIKLNAKMVKTHALGAKHGATPEELGAAVDKGYAVLEGKKEVAKAEVKQALKDMHLAAHQNVDSELHAINVGGLLAKHKGVLSKEDIASLGQSAISDFGQGLKSSQEDIEASYKKYHLIKNNPMVPDKQKAAAKNLHDATVNAHIESYGAKSAKDSEQVAKQNLAALASTGKTPISDPVQLTAKPTLADALQPEKSKAPGVAKPAAFKAPKTKAEALDSLKAIGSQYYLLKEGKYGGQGNPSSVPELADAHALYSKSKEAYKALGGSESEFSSLSTNLKNKAINDIKDAKNKEGSAKYTAGLTLTQSVTKLAHAKDNYGPGSPEVKEATKKLAEAKKAGAKVLSAVEMDKANAEGVANHAEKKAEAKKTALKDVHDASYNLHMATLLNKGKPDHPDVLDAAQKYSATMDKYAGTKTVTGGELNAEVSAAKTMAKINATNQAAFAKLYGNPTKIAASYDKADQGATEFKYPMGSSSFSKHGSNQISKLTAQEKKTIESYTGPGFRVLNREVGKAGTAKMKGLGGSEVSPFQIDKMEAMDSVFAKTTLGSNVKLRRNMAQNYLWDQLGVSEAQLRSGGQAAMDKLVGTVYKETAFSSTSMDSGFSGSFSNAVGVNGGAILRIRAGASMPGIRAKALSDHDTEEEVILPRGTTYVIRKITALPPGGTMRFEVHVDMVGAFPDKL